MAKIYCKSSYLLRRDTAANWSAKNPILREGEEGYETDTGKRKVGNGTTEWNNLKYDSGIVDQAYSPTSENAQSGKAVAEAILNADTSQKPFIKIADITLAEATTLVTITKDINGNDFSLTDIIVSLLIPPETARTISVYIGVSETPNTAAAFARITHGINGKYESRNRCYAVIRNGRIINVSSASSAGDNNYQQVSTQQILQGIGYLAANSIDRLHVFTYNEGFPAGTRIVIEGVAR